MPLLPRPSSKAISTVVEDRGDPTLPVILEFQMPSTTITTAPVPRSARRITWIISSMFAAIVLAMGLIKIDRVVTAQAVVISQSATLVVQPLENSIVRSIGVHEGEAVRAGQVLAQLDPTFAAADVGQYAAQVSTYQAQVSRLQAEADRRPFTYTGLNADLSLQAAIFAQRRSEYDYKMENYAQQIDSLAATLARANSDAAGYRSRLSVATNVEQMRRELERLQWGSKLNTLAAMDNRAEMERSLHNSENAAAGAKQDLAAKISERDGYVQSWAADVSQQLSDATGKLSDARQALNKAQLEKQLVEMRAERDSKVLTLAKVSVGSVLLAGQQFITLAPTDVPMEVEANVMGKDNGFVNAGDPVALKFDTFPFMQYGEAYGTVRTLSADSFSPQDEQRNPTGALPVPSNATDLYYRARISIDRVDLHGMPPDFHPTPGMPVTADIKVGKRTILQYLLGRVLSVGAEGMREP
ncbi:MAG TPA: HlyD family type I secretion periplasmic adaptor subunit [Acetobacteraceae bacterium]|nr:HlyD family type I secretion periplasmic adaptor subunit [Acetobacteraceae bacterium]